MAETLGERLKEKRLEKGMTLEEVAQFVGAYSRSTVGNWERGNTLPKPVFLKQFAKLFNVSIDWIKYGEDREEEALNELREKGKLEIKIIFNSDGSWDMTFNGGHSPECYGFLLSNMGKQILQDVDAFRPDGGDYFDEN